MNWRRVYLTILAATLAIAATVPAAASAARLASASEARAIYAKSKLVGGGHFNCDASCRWHAPIVSSSNSTWAFVSFDQLNPNAGYAFEYEGRLVLHRTQGRFKEAFATGGGAGSCDDAARVPEKVRKEFRIKCFSRQQGAGVGGPERVKARSRYIGDFGSGEIAGSFGGARLARAVRLFGDPGSQHEDGDACRTSWSKPGLTAMTFRGHPGEPCVPEARLISLTATHSGWYTSRGLKVGNNAKMLRKLYPAATTYAGPDNPTLETFTRRDPDKPGLGIMGGLVIRDLRNGTILDATLKDGRVTALTVQTIIGD